VRAFAFAALAVLWAGQQGAVYRGSAGHLFYDADQRRLLLLTSSRDTSAELLWRGANGQWTLAPGVGPPARELGGAAYDTRRKKLVLFGGIPNGGGDRLGDTWEWDGRKWLVMSDRGPGPGPRSHHMLAFDEARGVVVMHGGGASDRSLASDTWEWNGATWTQVATEGPGTRAHFAMTYDPARKRIILHGGFDERYKYLTDTWAWDGKTWTRIAEQGPIVRSHHAMAFDRRSGSVVLFGGLRNGRPDAPLGDTWILDGSEWRIVTAPGPEARTGHVMTYDPVRERTILHGGSAWNGRTSRHFNDTWAWDGRGWTRID
jgi:hypothetical protein